MTARASRLRSHWYDAAGAWADYGGNSRVLEGFVTSPPKFVIAARSPSGEVACFHPVE